MAYNKAIATEAQAKFSSGTKCMTTHSLAYQNTIRPFKLSIGYFNYRSITERIPYEHKVMVIETLKDFCLSKYSNYEDFVRANKLLVANVSDRIYDLVKKYFQAMTQGKIPITHDGYLKFYQLLLFKEKIKHKEFDVVMLDEAGDLNPVTLEIFKLLPAKKKIMVGDENQNIYTFNKTINGFHELDGDGLQLNMTKSFRCSEDIAKQIEGFCREHLDSSMHFVGTKIDDMTIKTSAFISRNNSTLVGKMIELNGRNIKYNLTRPVKSIFELILILLNLKENGKILSPEWKHIQDDVDDYFKHSHIQLEYSSPLKYITSLYGQEPGISSALNIIREHNPGIIFAAHDNAKAHEKEKGHAYTLCTAHSSKGLEFDKVTIADDLNDSVMKIITERQQWEYNEKDLETMRLYYVASSRTLKEIKNAFHLPNVKIDSNSLL